MHGLGKDAKGEDAVRFTTENSQESGPFVPALNKHLPYTSSTGSIAYNTSGLCLDTFWRSAENYSAEKTMWAVSQAAPLRRVHISKHLHFGDGGAYSSGGFLANAEVEGECDFIANQQWLSRGVDFKGDVSGGAWNIVFAGCEGNVPTPNILDGEKVVTVEEKPVVRMEKPFIVMNAEGNYELHVPKVITDMTSGSDLGSSNSEIRSFNQVKVAKTYLPTDEDGNYINHPSET